MHLRQYLADVVDRPVEVVVLRRVPVARPLGRELARSIGVEVFEVKREDKTPPALWANPPYLWASKTQRRRSDARKLAELAVGLCVGKATILRTDVQWDGVGYRGVVYAGRRSRREVAKAGA